MLKVSILPASPIVSVYASTELSRTTSVTCQNKRTAVRLFWHVTEVVRDNSVDAYTLTIGEAGKMLTFNTLFVWTQFVVVFWVGSLTGKSPAAKAAPGAVPVPAQQQQ